ncbi:MAG: DUF1249 domain-containing protein [Gammaproteobacteria bacterium]|nr:DUF1249 domain-containing protein [Gammaproteobacteria bacterium]
MSIYERNFRRLVTLLPELRVAVSSVPASNVGVLRVEVVERHKYTTLVSLAQPLPLFLPPLTMTVCIYHDAKVAEVIDYQESGRLRARYDYPNPDMFQVREKRRVNEFLGEWLDFCLLPRRRYGQLLLVGGA